MRLGIAEARQRLAYINQYRERTLGALFGLAVSARMLGWSVSVPVLALLGSWFVLAWGFVQVSTAARNEGRLNRIEFAYFLLELALIAPLAHYSGAAEWLALLFYVVTILYANLVLPRRSALWITALAAASFTGLVVLEWFAAARSGFSPVPEHAPGAWMATLVAGALAGYALIGLTLAQFALMLNRQTEALQLANHDLNATSQELRLHRDHLEDLVRQRTGELERANADLKRSNEIKSSFLASVSHELRTPLTSIRSFSEILLNYPDEDVATRCEFLGIIIHESDRLTRLINDVLDLAKIEAGKMEWRMRPVQLAEVVRESVEAIHGVAAQAGVRIENRILAPLPLVEADADRLAQVFTNLLSNALKFTRTGSVCVSAEAAAGEVVIAVADTGIGIPPADLEQIFEKFHQRGNALTDKPAGTGLGLSICREIVHRHGGRIWAESQLGHGSVFRCALPRLAFDELGAPELAALAPSAPG